MEKVTGIGGFFFRSSDPKKLARWYADNLGISLTPSDYVQPSWTQEAGPTVFQPFPKDTKYFHGSWMLNLRVRNLDAMVAQLRAADITVEVDPKSYPNGKFATLHDPEENPIQLWEPAGRDAARPTEANR
jgi:predicted enzyme related to lactoylglutathione lyase